MNLAIVSTNQYKYSETFIHNHVRLLPTESTHYLHGGYLPHYHSNGLLAKKVPFRIPTRKKGFLGKFIRNKNERSDKELLKESIKNYLRDRGIDIVLAEYGPSGVEMMDICEDLGIPLVVHFHGYTAYRKDMLEAYGDRYKAMFHKAAAVIGVSKHMCAQLVRLGLDERKLYYNPYGPDQRYFQYSDASQTGKELIGVGRFAETKSQHLTLLAFAQVLKVEPTARLTLVGDGHLQEACIILANSLGIAHAVRFTGVVAHERVGELMRTSRAFVQHSITTPSNDTEGTPVAIIEACAAGLPIVSTRHAGIPDVVLEGKTGFLVDEGDINGMAEYMIRLLQSKEEAGRLGKAGHERVAAFFTMEKHIERLTEILYDALP